MKFIDVILSSYPLYATFHSIKKPRNFILKHWLTYWTIYLWLSLFDYFTFGIIPMMSLFKVVILLPNWNPHVTSFSFTTIVFWIQKTHKKIQKIQNLNQLKFMILDQFESTYTKLKTTIPILQTII